MDLAEKVDHAKIEIVRPRQGATETAIDVPKVDRDHPKIAIGPCQTAGVQTVRREVAASIRDWLGWNARSQRYGANSKRYAERQDLDLQNVVPIRHSAGDRASGHPGSPDGKVSDLRLDKALTRLVTVIAIGDLTDRVTVIAIGDQMARDQMDHVMAIGPAHDSDRQGTAEIGPMDGRTADHVTDVDLTDRAAMARDRMAPIDRVTATDPDQALARQALAAIDRKVAGPMADQAKDVDLTDRAAMARDQMAPTDHVTAIDPDQALAQALAAIDRKVADPMADQAKDVDLTTDVDLTDRAGMARAGMDSAAMAQDPMAIDLALIADLATVRDRMAHRELNGMIQIRASPLSP